MFELMIESHKVPWLIWIQLLVMLLLALILLSHFCGFFALDLDSSSSSLSDDFQESVAVTSRAERIQVGSNHDVQRDRATTAVARIRVKENNRQENGSLAEESVARAKMLDRMNHPCQIFDFARRAFLKCLGLGSTLPNSHNSDHTED